MKFEHRYALTATAMVSEYERRKQENIRKVLKTRYFVADF